MCEENIFESAATNRCNGFICNSNYQCASGNCEDGICRKSTSEPIDDVNPVVTDEELAEFEYEWLVLLVISLLFTIIIIVIVVRRVRRSQRNPDNEEPMLQGYNESVMQMGYGVPM